MTGNIKLITFVLTNLIKKLRIKIENWTLRSIFMPFESTIRSCMLFYLSSLWSREKQIYLVRTWD